MISLLLLLLWSPSLCPSVITEKLSDRGAELVLQPISDLHTDGRIFYRQAKSCGIIVDDKVAIIAPWLAIDTIVLPEMGEYILHRFQDRFDGIKPLKASGAAVKMETNGKLHFNYCKTETFLGVALQMSGTRRLFWLEEGYDVEYLNDGDHIILGHSQNLIKLMDNVAYLIRQGYGHDVIERALWITPLFGKCLVHLQVIRKFS